MAFFELNIAMSGLFASQNGLQVTSNNISNANTVGYSRQVLNQKASTPLNSPGVGMLGTGASATGISRIRDSYIDSKLWGQNPGLGEYNIKVTQNSLVEAAFGEPSDEGFTAVFNDMFNRLSDLSKDPSSKDAQTAYRQELVNYTKYYNNITGSLQKYQQDLNYQLKATVQEINTLATRIQSLNKQIFESEIFGSEANSFRDERDLCIDRLSQIGNVEVEEYEDNINGQITKKFKVKYEGQTLVDHFSANTLTVEVRGKLEGQINDVTKALTEKYAEIDKLNAMTPPSPTLADDVKKIKEQIKEIQDEAKALSPDIAIDGSGNMTYNSQPVFSVTGTGTTRVVLDEKKLNKEDAGDLYDVVWESGLPFNMLSTNLSGELKGIIDMRDGGGTQGKVTYNGIPYYIKRMDTYVREFAKSMNEQYSKNKDGNIEIDAIGLVAAIEKNDKGDIVGFYDEQGVEITTISQADKDNIKDNYVPKNKLFTYRTSDASSTSTDGSDLKGGNYENMTSANFSISKELLDNPENMKTTYDKDNPSDNSFILELLAQKDNNHMFKEGDPKDYMISIFSELGINVKEAKMYQNTQKSVTDTIINQRLSVSQVDQTEEFTMLIKYQQAYQAAAKVMSTMDGIYETTIFKLGNY